MTACLKIDLSEKKTIYSMSIAIIIMYDYVCACACAALCIHSEKEPVYIGTMGLLAKKSISSSIAN